MNPNPSSRPFLRLFSALHLTDQPSEKACETSGKPGNSDSVVPAGLVHNTPCGNHHDTKIQSSPLHSEEHSEEKMIAGSVGPRSTSPRRVEVSLAEIAPVLADAINHQRGWLSDFSDDTVSIDADLYEVLLAYQQMRRLNAA